MLVLPQSITHKNADACLKVFLKHIDTLSEPVEMDASQLSTFDSSALAVLLACKRHAAKQGKYCSTHSLPEQLSSLAKVYGIDELIDSTGTI